MQTQKHRDTETGTRRDRDRELTTKSDWQARAVPKSKNGAVQQTQKTHITQQQYQAQKTNENRALSVIQQFAGDPANMHFEAVSDRMLQLLQAPQVLGDTSQMSEREKLQLAYDTAIRLDPQLAQTLYAQQQQQATATAQVQRARTAAVSVRGAPGGSANPAINQQDRRAVIANALRSFG